MIKLQPRDIEIIKLLGEYRFLDLEQLWALFPTSGREGLKKRLRTLELEGYLVRPKGEVLLEVEKGKKVPVYSLGKKAKEILSLPKWSYQAKEASVYQLLHFLGINNFRLSLEKALKLHPEAELLFFEDFKDGVNPDGYFAIRVREKELYFFLEYDRGTMTRKRLLEKFKGYWRFFKEGKHKELGMENFRVLTVSPDRRRREFLRRIAKAADDKKKGSRLFYFASEEDFSLEDPKVLSWIWRTPADDRWYALVG